MQNTAEVRHEVTVFCISVVTDQICSNAPKLISIPLQFQANYHVAIFFKPKSTLKYL